MKGKVSILLALILVISCCTACGAVSNFPNNKALEDSPQWIVDLAKEHNADQLFVVAGIGQTTAYISMHEQDASGKWYTIMTTPGYIGKYGLGKTKEGDGMTPVGSFRFTEAFGIADNPGTTKYNYKKVTDDDWWSGDVNYKYNQMVNIKDYPDLSKDDSEHIIDYTYQYKYAMNISYNQSGEAGKGSAIFLHCLGPYKPYTGGCVAIPEDKMVTVLKNVDRDCIVVIDSLKNLSPETWDEWGLN